MGRDQEEKAYRWRNMGKNQRWIMIALHCCLFGVWSQWNSYPMLASDWSTHNWTMAIVISLTSDNWHLSREREKSTVCDEVPREFECVHFIALVCFLFPLAPIISLRPLNNIWDYILRKKRHKLTFDMSERNAVRTSLGFPWHGSETMWINHRPHCEMMFRCSPSEREGKINSTSLWCWMGLELNISPSMTSWNNKNI